MKTATPKSVEPDSYFRLVRKFPLRPLRREADIAAANEVVAQLLVSKPEEERDDGESDYLDTLTVLIQDAEKEALHTLTKNITPVDLIKHLMEERQMSVSDLGKVVGGQAAASLILGNKRSISKTQIRGLADYFKLSPAAFIAV